MKGGKSEVMCEHGQLFKVTKSKSGLAEKKPLTNTELTGWTTGR
jgi:hypothetical protein